jgi:hypothetical protein
MIKVTSIVKTILVEDEIAFGSYVNGHLNMTSYAESIRDRVEKLCKKPVRVGTIVVALSRLSLEKSQLSIETSVDIQQLTVKSPLTELVFDKADYSTEEVQHLFTSVSIDNADFFTVTYGTNEITLLFSSSMEEKVESLFTQKPKAIVTKLSALSIRFSDNELTKPNVLYSLLKRLALKRIVLIELVSTYTELTFIMKSRDIARALQAFE